MDLKWNNVEELPPSDFDKFWKLLATPDPVNNNVILTTGFSHFGGSEENNTDDQGIRDVLFNYITRVQSNQGKIQAESDLIWNTARKYEDADSKQIFTGQDDLDKFWQLRTDTIKHLCGTGDSDKPGQFHYV